MEAVDGTMLPNVAKKCKAISTLAKLNGSIMTEDSQDDKSKMEAGIMYSS